MTSEEHGDRVDPPRAPWAVQPMEQEALREFVLGVCDGRIFTSLDVANHRLLGAVFMPLTFGALDGCTNISEVGLVWEWMHAAGKLGINGMPTFFSCRLMLASDWLRAHTAILAEMERRKAIEI